MSSKLVNLRAAQARGDNVLRTDDPRVGQIVYDFNKSQLAGLRQVKSPWVRTKLDYAIGLLKTVNVMGVSVYDKKDDLERLQKLKDAIPCDYRSPELNALMLEWRPDLSQNVTILLRVHKKEGVLQIEPAKSKQSLGFFSSSENVFVQSKGDFLKSADDLSKQIDIIQKRLAELRKTKAEFDAMGREPLTSYGQMMKRNVNREIREGENLLTVLRGQQDAVAQGSLTKEQAAGKAEREIGSFLRSVRDEDLSQQLLGIDSYIIQSTFVLSDAHQFLQQ